MPSLTSSEYRQEHLFHGWSGHLSPERVAVVLFHEPAVRVLEYQGCQFGSGPVLFILYCLKWLRQGILPVKISSMLPAVISLVNQFHVDTTPTYQE